MSLRVVRSEPAYPLPDCGGLLACARRPGELHEPIALAAELGERLAARAARNGIDVSVAGTLLIEAKLLRRDLAALGLQGLTSELAQRAELPARPLSSAEGNYLRSLTIRRPTATRKAPVAKLSLPVRLLGRIDAALIPRALEGPLAEAICWETSALARGSTIGEWGLRRALELSGRALAG